MKSPFPQDWKEYTIGDCLRRVEHPVEVDSDALYTQIGIRSHGKGLFYKEPVTGELLGSKAVYWVEPNCFILNIVFAWEQAIGKTTQAEVGMIGSHRFPMYKPVNNLIDIDYLVYYLLTKRGTDILEAASPGGAGRNRTLGQDRFMKSRIVLPPLDEQQKIAEILATQDKAIELQGRKIEELKRFKKGCLEKMFPRKGQKVPEKRFPGFTDDWEQRKLGELGSLKNGMNFSKEAMGIGFPFINLQNIFGNNVIDVTNLGKAMASDSQLKDYNLLNGDVLFVRSSVKLQGVGEAALVPQNLENTTYSGFIIRFRDEYGLDNNFKRFLFGIESVRNQIMAQATNSANKNISQTVLENLCLKIPNKSEQENIGLYFSNLDKLITLHQRKLEEMKKQKKALMQLLLTGIVKTKGEVR